MISIPKSLKNQPWNQYCPFGDPIHEKVTKITPKWIPREPQRVRNGAGVTQGSPKSSFPGTLEKGVPGNAPGHPKKVTNTTPQKCVFEQPYGKYTNQDIINLVDIFAGANQSDMETWAQVVPKCGQARWSKVEAR